MHERMYTINKVSCMFPRCTCVCVCEERERDRRKKEGKRIRSFLLFFLYHDRMLMLKAKWIVREKKKNICLKESKLHNEITTIDDKSIGNSDCSNFVVNNIFIQRIYI